MTAEQLQALEAELQQRGYRKYTGSSTANESWAWFKTFARETDEDGRITGGYQVAFRVWDRRPYQHRDPDMHPYGFDFWTSLLGTDLRTDLTSNREPIADLDTFERLAAEFNAMVRKFINP